MAQHHKPKYSSGKQPSGSKGLVIGLVAVMAVLVLFSLGLRLLLGTPQAEPQLEATAPAGTQEPQQEPTPPSRRRLVHRCGRGCSAARRRSRLPLSRSRSMWCPRPPSPSPATF